MVLKKVDNRIRVLIENGVQKRQRSLFVVVGDKGKDQVSCTIFTRFLSCVVLVWFCSLSMSDYVYKTTYVLTRFPYSSFSWCTKITAVFALCDKFNIWQRQPESRARISESRPGYWRSTQRDQRTAVSLSKIYLSVRAWCASLLSSWAQQITYVYLLYMHFH